MKSTIAEINKVQKRVTIACDSTEVSTAFQKAYTSIKKKAKIHGFRPGKAPLQMIKKLYGQSVAGEVADQLIKDHLFTVIDEHKLQPVGAPVIETDKLPNEGQEYEFSAIIDEMESVDVTGYTNLQLTGSSTAVTDEDVEQHIDRIRRRQATTKLREEGQAAGDQDIVKFDQKFFNAEGEEVPGFTASDIPIELGTEALIPEMETALRGAKVGETREASFKLPEDYGDEALRGQQVRVEVVIKEIQEVILPEKDDNFAKDVGVDDLEALRVELRKNIEKQAEQAKRQHIEAQVFEKLNTSNPIEVPPAIVDQVIDSIAEDHAEQNKLDAAELKKNQEFRNQAKDQAKQQARNSILLMEIVKKENLELSSDDIKSYLREVIPTTMGDEKSEQLIESLAQGMPDNQKQTMLFTKALDWIIDQAEVTAVEA